MPTPFLLNGILASQISGHLYSGPAGAFDALGSVTVGAGGQSSITFSAIPQTYTHLQVRIFMATGNYTNLRFNGDTTTSNYYNHNLSGNGSSASATATASAAYSPLSGGTYGYADIIDILDYANTNKNKVTRSLEGYDNNGSGQVFLNSNLWMSTAAINSITFTAGATNFGQYSNFSLYGIK